MAATWLVGICVPCKQIGLFSFPSFIIAIQVNMRVRRAFIPNADGLMVRVAHSGGQIALTDIDGRPFPLGILLRKM